MMDFFNNNGYSRFDKELVDLYVDCFSKGDSAQDIDLVSLSGYLKNISEQGINIYCTDKNHLIGAILSVPMKSVNDLPAFICDNYDTNNSLYIAELMINEKYRGQGIGKNLLHHLFEKLNNLPYTNIFIRVWDQNIAAVHLYRRFGFKEVAEIYQTKLKPLTKQKFVMRKIYLHMYKNDYYKF